LNGKRADLSEKFKTVRKVETSWQEMENSLVKAHKFLKPSL
jgi:hypothetical protein